jgi:hypothetical protein
LAGHDKTDRTWRFRIGPGHRSQARRQRSRNHSLRRSKPSRYRRGSFLQQGYTMNAPPKARTRLLLGAACLVLLIALGFNRGWLAWHSDQRPLGKLRPVDLVTATSVPESSELPQSTGPYSQPSTIPAPPTARATSTTSDDDQSRAATTTSNPAPVNSSPHDNKPTSDNDHDADD